MHAHVRPLAVATFALAVAAHAPADDGLTITEAARVNNVVFSPDGRRLASSGGDGTVRVVDVIARIGRTVVLGPPTALPSRGPGSGTQSKTAVEGAKGATF